jgi:hypothetical protein
LPLGEALHPLRTILVAQNAPAASVPRLASLHWIAEERTRSAWISRRCLRPPANQQSDNDEDDAVEHGATDQRDDPTDDEDRRDDPQDRRDPPHSPSLRSGPDPYLLSLPTERWFLPQPAPHHIPVPGRTLCTFGQLCVTDAPGHNPPMSSREERMRRTRLPHERRTSRPNGHTRLTRPVDASRYRASAR